jgi:hypothetical protein
MSDQYTHIELEQRIAELERQLADCVPWETLQRVCKLRSDNGECPLHDDDICAANWANCPLKVRY